MNTQSRNDWFEMYVAPQLGHEYRRELDSMLLQTGNVELPETDLASTLRKRIENELLFEAGSSARRDQRRRHLQVIIAGLITCSVSLFLYWVGSTSPVDTRIDQPVPLRFAYAKLLNAETSHSSAGVSRMLAPGEARAGIAWLETAILGTLRSLEYPESEFRQCVHRLAGPGSDCNRESPAQKTAPDRDTGDHAVARLANRLLGHY